MAIWQTTRFHIDLSTPQVMGIVNLTPDSFSDGGRHAETAAGIAHCERLVKEGAHILDLGGESTRPGARTLEPLEEWARIEGVLKAALTLGVPVSIDTCKTEVMQRALDAGADIVNDIRALLAPGAEAAVTRHPQCGICLMHMQGDPATMQQRPSYPDVVSEVTSFLQARAQALLDQGVAHDRITLDPGIGFGKSPEHNLALMREQERVLALGWPLLLGWSRKSTLGHLTGRDVGDRLAASLAAALASVQKGARIVRVHDVAQTVDALKVWQAAGFLG
jgi:dihydropteroate synthase